MGTQKPETQYPATNTQPLSAAYLQGDELKHDTGPLLSIFALQSVLEKVRAAQTALRNEGAEPDPVLPAIDTIFSALSDLANERGYRVEKHVPCSYRFHRTQSDTYFFQVDQMFEGIAAPRSYSLDTSPELLSLVSDRIRQLRDAGSFILHAVPTRYIQGREVVGMEALGLDVDGLFKILDPRLRYQLQERLDQLIVLNQDFNDIFVDAYMAACPAPVYEVHRAVMGFVMRDHRQYYHRVMGWLNDYGEFKRVHHTRELLTDVFSPDTVYVQSFDVPADPNIIWEVPRSGVANLIINAALGVPSGAYIAPNPRLATVTIASRVTTTTPFGTILSMTPTEAQMNDVRKIYLALLFPNQILLEIRPEPGHQTDTVASAVAGILSKMMFSYGPRLFNVTPHAARMIDCACATFLQMAGDGRRVIRRGPTREPLDFQIVEGHAAFDANVLRADPATGRGFSSWHADAMGQGNTPYPHIRRRVFYLGYDPEDVIDERFSGDDFRYPLHDIICEALRISGHVAERNYIEAMRQHHVVRMAYINQVINRDLVSAFSLPDDRFDGLAANIPRDAKSADGPVVLDVSFLSIIHAFRLRFLPLSRPQRVIEQPLLESVYTSYLSVAKEAARSLQAFQNANNESFMDARPMDVWKAVYPRIPEPIRKILEMTGQHSFITGRDVDVWMGSQLMQPSLLLVAEQTAWRLAMDPQVIGFSREVYLHREIIPQHTLEDVAEFRRAAVYYTNVMDGRPPNDRRVVLSRNIMARNAGAGRLKLMLKGMLDNGMFIQTSAALRPLILSIHAGLPPHDVLSALPYVYRRATAEGPTARVELSLVHPAQIYYILFEADELSFPDELTSLTPTYSLVKVALDEPPVRRVDFECALAAINRDFHSIRSKVRILDLAGVLRSGSQFSIPSTVL
uniref:Inner core protein n=1 Tax=Wad Medani virus TaxID=40067 RepID=A0A3G1RNY1_9REOV|nr:inner core protein [Wad Medani virus]